MAQVLLRRNNVDHLLLRDGTSKLVLIVQRGAFAATSEFAAAFVGASTAKGSFSATLESTAVFAGHNAGATITITDTTILQLPVNCMLLADHPVSRMGRDDDIQPMRIRERPLIRAGG